MNSGQHSDSKPADPFEPFRAMRDAYLDAMAKTMVEAVNTEAYAQASGTMLEGYLSASAPFREAIEKSMVQALQQLSLPSRQEVAVLAERFTNLELRLDDMDAKLGTIEKMMRPESPVPGASEATPSTLHGTTVKKTEAEAATTRKRPAVRRRLVRKTTTGTTQR